MNPKVIDILKKIFRWLFGSFDTSDIGASAKKLTAFAFMLLIFWLHWKYVDKENVVEVLIIDTSVVLGLLGVATYDKIQERKTKQSQDNGESQP